MSSIPDQVTIRWSATSHLSAASNNTKVNVTSEKESSWAMIPVQNGGGSDYYIRLANSTLFWSANNLNSGEIVLKDIDTTPPTGFSDAETWTVSASSSFPFQTSLLRKGTSYGLLRNGAVLFENSEDLVTIFDVNLNFSSTVPGTNPFNLKSSGNFLVAADDSEGDKELTAVNTIDNSEDSRWVFEKLEEGTSNYRIRLNGTTVYWSYNNADTPTMTLKNVNQASALGVTETWVLGNTLNNSQGFHTYISPIGSSTLYVGPNASLVSDQTNWDVSRRSESVSGGFPETTTDTTNDGNTTNDSDTNDGGDDVPSSTLGGDSSAISAPLLFGSIAAGIVVVALIAYYYIYVYNRALPTSTTGTYAPPMDDQMNYTQLWEISI